MNDFYDHTKKIRELLSETNAKLSNIMLESIQPINGLSAQINNLYKPLLDESIFPICKIGIDNLIITPHMESSISSTVNSATSIIKGIANIKLGLDSSQLYLKSLGILQSKYCSFPSLTHDCLDSFPKLKINFKHLLFLKDAMNFDPVLNKDKIYAYDEVINDVLEDNRKMYSRIEEDPEIDYEFISTIEKQTSKIEKQILAAKSLPVLNGLCNNINKIYFCIDNLPFEYRDTVYKIIGDLPIRLFELGLDHFVLILFWTLISFFALDIRSLSYLEELRKKTNV